MTHSGFIPAAIFAIFIATWLAAISVVVRVRWAVAARAEFIRQYTWPVGLYERMRKRRPDLTPKDFQLVGQALRQFFLAYLKSGRKFVSMPSQLADELWHEFILYTKNYDFFCKRGFGRFLHHSPAAVLSSGGQSNAGLRRTWWFSCREESIDPHRPSRLPLLFALDAKLDIADGFRYATDCGGLRTSGAKDEEGHIIYCGGDFGSMGVDGSIEGFGDSGAGHGGHSGDGGHGGDSGGSGGHGCGGHGCGGGGCGGGD